MAIKIIKGESAWAVFTETDYGSKEFIFHSAHWDKERAGDMRDSVGGTAIVRKISIVLATDKKKSSKR